jgi:hypothetical protein
MLAQESQWEHRYQRAHLATRDAIHGSGRITDKPHLTACFSDWSRHAASDSGIWQSRPLRIKWQDWIAPGGMINSSSGMLPVAA